jgi:hypothetical protein
MANGFFDKIQRSRKWDFKGTLPGDPIPGLPPSDQVFEVGALRIDPTGNVVVYTH